MVVSNLTVAMGFLFGFYLISLPKKLASLFFIINVTLHSFSKMKGVQNESTKK